MNFYNNDVRKVIYHISTRWLSLGKCLERTLMQWYSLKSYFKSNFDLDDDPTENYPDEKPSREKRLVNTFTQRVTKLFAMFVQSVIPIFDSFNTFLWAEETLIHILYCIILLCVCIAHYFQHLSYLKLSKKQIMCIDVEDLDVSKDFNSIFIGAMAKQYSRDSDIIRTSEYKKTIESS